MKRNGFRQLMGIWAAITLIVAAFAPGTAEQSGLDLQPLLALAGEMEPQAPVKGNFEIPDELPKLAANASLHADAASSRVSDNWDYGFFMTELSEESTIAQFCTVLMIEDQLLVLATDNTPYDAIRKQYSADVLDSIIMKYSYVMLPDTTGKNYYKLNIDGFVFSEDLPLLYILLLFDDSIALEDIVANNPEGSKQYVAGYFQEDQGKEISIWGDNLIPKDTLRSTLESGKPFLPGSPVYSGNRDKTVYATPAIGIQARDGYVYSAKEALKALILQVQAEDESAAVTTAPEPASTSRPTATPKITQSPTDAPETGSTDTSREEDDTKPTATPKKGRDSGVEEQSSLIQNGQIPYWIIGVAALVLLLWFVYRRGKQNAGKQKTAEKVELIRPNEYTASPVSREPVRNEQRGVNSLQTAPTPGIQETMKLSVEETMSLEGKKSATSSIRASIRGISGAFAGKEFSLHGKTLIGRDPERCGIVCPREALEISGVHCAVELAADEPVLILTDEGSSNGTFVGEYQLKPGKPVRLRNGARFHLAAEKHTFEVVIDTRGK